MPPSTASESLLLSTIPRSPNGFINGLFQVVILFAVMSFAVYSIGRLLRRRMSTGDDTLNLSPHVQNMSTYLRFPAFAYGVKC